MPRGFSRAYLKKILSDLIVGIKSEYQYKLNAGTREPPPLDTFGTANEYGSDAGRRISWRISWIVTRGKVGGGTMRICTAATRRSGSTTFRQDEPLWTRGLPRVRALACTLHVYKYNGDNNNNNNDNDNNYTRYDCVPIRRIARQVRRCIIIGTVARAFL